MIMFNPNRNEIEVMLDENALMPVRAHDDDAGMDLLSPVDALVPAHGSVEINTGVHVNLPCIDLGQVMLRTAGLLKSKSGLYFKHGIMGEGTVDVGYTGCVRVKLYNLSDTDYQIRRKDKIIQLLITPVLTPKPKDVDQFYGILPGGRGDGGFGSTGR